VEDNKAVVEIDSAALIEQLKVISEAANRLNQQLTDNQIPVQAKKEMTLDLGDVDADETEVALPAEVVAAMKESGFDSVAVKVNGVALSFSVEDLGDETQLNISRQPASEHSEAQNRRTASDVYTFNFQSDGSSVTHFSQPVNLTIPVNADDDMD